jgi:plasmid stabilization system protein ParE
MAEVSWTIPSLNDLATILDYIELEDEEAAKRLAREVFEKGGPIVRFPEFWQ